MKSIKINIHHTKMLHTPVRELLLLFSMCMPVSRGVHSEEEEDLFDSDNREIMSDYDSGSTSEDESIVHNNTCDPRTVCTK